MAPSARLLVRSSPFRANANSLATNLLDPTYVDADPQRVIAAAENDTAQRAHVRVVTAPAKRDVAIGSEQVVGGIDVDPFQSRHVYGKPGVRGVGADQALDARRRHGFQVPADVACGDAQ